MKAGLEGDSMEITLDITKCFNTAVNTDSFYGKSGLVMSPTIFFDKPFGFEKEFGFGLMNFGLNISEEMHKGFILKSPHFDDILLNQVPQYAPNSVLIFGKARIEIKNLKGLCIALSPLHGKPEETLYLNHHSKLYKDDMLYELGGSSAFSPHYFRIVLIADKLAKASLSFSSEDYILDNQTSECSEIFYQEQVLKYDYLDAESRFDILERCSSAIRPKIFNVDYRNKYFRTAEGRNFGGYEFAVADED